MEDDLPAKPVISVTPLIPMIHQREDGSIDMGQLDALMNDYGHSMRRDRPYDGQPWTDKGIRGATEIKGITFRDLRDAFIRAVLLSTGGEKIGDKNMKPYYEQACKGEDAILCGNDLFGWDLDQLDPLAIAQNLAVEVEKLMGIFPNLPIGTPTADEVLNSIMPPDVLDKNE